MPLLPLRNALGLDGLVAPGPQPVDLSTQGTIRDANSVATIVSQIAASSAGDTVRIAAGNYAYVTTTKSIGSGLIRIIPASPGSVSIAGIDMSSAQGLDWRGINTTGATNDNVWFQNSIRCRFRGGYHKMTSSTAVAFTVRTGSSDIIVEDVTVENALTSFIVQGFTETARATNITFQRFRSLNVGQDHVFLSRGDNVIVQDFVTYGHTDTIEHSDGVQIVGIKNTTIRRGHLYNSRTLRQNASDRNDHGVIINYDPAETPEGRVPENIILENLLIHDQTASGIAVAGCLGVTIRNCTSYDNGLNGTDYGLNIDADAGNTINGVVVVNNIFNERFNSGEATYTTDTNNFVADGSGPTGTNRLTGAPGFVDATNLDYRLTSVSQNSGSGTATGAATLDIYNITRLSPPSRGAIEYVPATLSGAVNLSVVPTLGATPYAPQSARYNAEGENHTNSTGLGTLSNYTISFWGKLASDRNNWSCFVKPGAMEIITNATGTTLTLWNGTNESPFASPPNLTVGTWYHFVLSVSGSTAATLYYKPYGGSYTTTTATLLAGGINFNNLLFGWNNVAGEWLDGNVAAPKIWTAALNSTEAQAEGNQYDAARTANLVRAWRLNGTTAEQTGNGTSLLGGTGATWEDGPIIPLTAGAQTYDGAVSLSATATLTSAAQLNAFAAVSLSATATLTSAGIRETSGAVSLSSSPTLTASGVRTTSGAVSLSASATLTSQSIQTFSAAVSLTSSPTITVAGIRTTSGAVSLSSSPTLTVQPFLTAPLAVSLSATATLTAAGAITHSGVVSLSVSSTLTTDGVRTTFGVVSLSSSPTLTVSGTLTAFAAISMSVVSSLTATAYLGAFAAVSLSSSPTLTTDGIRTTSGAVSIAATYSFSADGSVFSGGFVNLSVSPTLTVTAPLRTTFGTVSLSVSPSLTADGLRTTSGQVSLSATYTLSANAGTQTGTVSLTSSPTLTVANVRLIAFASVSLVSAPTLTVTGRLGAFALVSMSVGKTLTIDSAGGTTGAVSLASTPTLVVSGVRETVANVALIVSYAISIASVRTTDGAVSLTPSVVISFDASTFGTAGINLTPQVALTVGGIKLTQSSLLMTVVATMTAAAFVGGWPPIFGPPVVDGVFLRADFDEVRESKITSQVRGPLIKVGAGQVHKNIEFEEE